MHAIKNPDELVEKVEPKRLSALLLHIIKRILVAAGILANIIFVLGLIYISLLLAFKYLAPSFTLPNGYVISPTWFDTNNIRLYNPKRIGSVEGRVENIGWCDDIIYGTQHTVIGLFNKTKSETRYFIYDGKENRIEYIDTFPPNAELRARYNLPEWPGQLITYEHVKGMYEPPNTCPGRKYWPYRKK